jgi:hypothetical protein
MITIHLSKTLLEVHVLISSYHLFLFILEEAKYDKQQEKDTAT